MFRDTDIQLAVKDFSVATPVSFLVPKTISRDYIRAVKTLELVTKTKTPFPPEWESACEEKVFEVSGVGGGQGLEWDTLYQDITSGRITKVAFEQTIPHVFDWEYYVCNHFDELKQLGLVDDLRFAYETMLLKHTFGDIVTNLGLLIQNGVPVTRIHDDLLAQGDMEWFVGSARELEEHGATIDWKGIYSRLESEKRYGLIITYAELFFKRGVELDIVSVYKRYLEGTEVIVIHPERFLKIARKLGVSLQKERRACIDQKDWKNAAIFLHSDREAIPRDDVDAIFNGLRNKKDWSTILYHYEVFEKHGQSKKLKKIITDAIRNLDEDLIDTYPKLFDAELKLSRDERHRKLFQKLLEEKRNDLILERAQTFIQLGYTDEVLLAYEEARVDSSSQWTTILEQCAGTLLENGIHAEQFVADLLERKLYECVYKNRHRFESRGVKVPYANIMEQATEATDGDFLLNAFSTFLEHGVIPNQAAARVSFPFFTLALHELLLQERFEILAVYEHHHLLTAHEVTPDFPACIEILRRQKRFRTAKMVAYLTKNTDPAEPSRPEEFTIFNFESVSIDDSIAELFFLESMAVEIALLATIPDVRHKIHDQMKLQKLTGYVAQKREKEAEVFELLRQHLLLVICERVNRSVLNDGQLDVDNDFESLIQSGNREKVISFLVHALGKFGHASNITFNWIRIANVALELWVSDTPNPVLINKAIGIQHNGGLTFNRDPRLRNPEDEETNKLLDIKRHAARIDDLVPALAQLDFLDSALIGRMHQGLRIIKSVRSEVRA